MKRFQNMVAIACAILATSAAAGIERFYVAKITDNAGETEYKVMTDEEFKALDKEIDDEGRLHMKAIAEARDAWKESDNEGPFQSSAAKARKLTKSGMTYRDRADAEEQVSKYLDRDARSAEYRAEKEKAAKKNTGSRTYKKSAEAVARDKERDARREVIRSKSLEIYQMKLKELLDAKRAAEKARNTDAPAAP